MKLIDRYVREIKNQRLEVKTATFDFWVAFNQFLLSISLPYVKGSLYSCCQVGPEKLKNRKSFFLVEEGAYEFLVRTDR